MIRKVLLAIGFASVLGAVACTGQVVEAPPAPGQELGEVQQGLDGTPAAKAPNGAVRAADGEHDVVNADPFIRPTTIVSNAEPGKPDPTPWDGPVKPAVNGYVPPGNGSK
ncbi:MAG: hypothetical protein HOO96_26650 [Polyangiaceae bacterium]|nr:hypothetical protein [Polyangiaceae bacterium]